MNTSIVVMTINNSLENEDGIILLIAKGIIGIVTIATKHGIITSLKYTTIGKSKTLLSVTTHTNWFITEKRIVAVKTAVASYPK